MPNKRPTPEELAKRYWAPHLVPSNTATPGRWMVQHVSSGEASVEVEQREANMPLPATAEDLMIARHEYGHLQTHFRMRDAEGETLPPTSPVQQFGLLLQEPMVEAISLASGFDIRRARDGLDFESIEHPAPDDRLANALGVLQYAFSYKASQNPKLQSYAQEFMNRMLADPDRVTLSDAYKETVARATAYGSDLKNEALRDALGECVTRWAHKLADVFGKVNEPPVPEEQTDETTQARIEKLAEIEAELQAQEQAQKQDQQERFAEGKTAEPPVEGDAVQTTIVVHRHITAKRGGKRAPSLWRPTDSMGPLRFPQRYLDGTPFARRSRGGGILIDISASNYGAVSQLEHVIRKLPNLWVATHVGSHEPGIPGPTGRVCVVAEKGRFGWWEREPGLSGGNAGSDLPALRLMVKESQPPFIWVSDGEAWCSSTNGGQAGKQEELAYLRECIAFCRKYGVVRVTSLQDAADYALGKQVWVYQGASVVDPGYLGYDGTAEERQGYQNWSAIPTLRRRGN